jgi:hypothetical protein
MSKFDPFEHLLRNFSKHKFKTFIEKSILTLNSYSEDHLPEYGKVHKNDWDKNNFAYMDMPTTIRERYFGGIPSYSRWIFHLDYIEDGLIKEKNILENARNHVIYSSQKLANDKSYLAELKKTLYDKIGEHPFDGEGLLFSPVYGTAMFYYLTNAGINPYDKEKGYDNFLRAIDSEVRSIFLEQARKFGIDIDKANFQVGLGCPKTFLQEMRDQTIAIIEKIEKRPDSINLQFVEGHLSVTCSNKRLFNVYDKQHPKILLLDELINPNSYFIAEEIQEFEALLNDPGTREAKLQKFLEARPKFLLGIDYDELRPQISLIDESGKELKPDFFLRTTGEKLWDIMDIKRATESLVTVRQNRERLAQCVHDGISQLMNYARFFDNPYNREKVKQYTGIDCCKPRLTLVIGKRRNIDEALWKRIIEQERPFVNIVGFDDILEKAKKLIIKTDV